MNLAIQRFKAYSKLILIILFTLFIFLMIYMNWDNQVTVWFLIKFEAINVSWLIFVTALFAVLGWITLRFAFGVVTDLKALKKHEDDLENKKRQDELMKRLDREDPKGTGGLTPGISTPQSKPSDADDDAKSQ
ncbi:MAG: hypothetical protein DHS20C16_04270 [Phycisphaerae bacterium]|nr:MAG: hypothetical protein DHS20C16_04270 [Phycisphaerae bacterium]